MTRKNGKNGKAATGRGDDRTPKYRHQDALLVERAAEWDAVARDWIKQACSEAFLRRPDQDLTAGDLVVELDQRPDLPLGYAQFIQPALYDKRYQLVRTVLEGMSRAGQLLRATTVNARGRRDVKCYRLAPGPVVWQLILEPAGGDGVELARQSLEQFLREHVETMMTLDSVLICRQVESGTTRGLHARAATERETGERQA